MTTAPYSGKSSDRLSALINKHNKRQIVLGEDFVFGKIQIIDDPSRSYNTQVQLISLKDQFKDQTIHYFRPSINAFHNAGGLIKPVKIYRNHFRTHQILTELKEASGLDFETTDLIDDEYERNDHHLITIDSQNSLGWSGGTILIVADNRYARLTMNGALRVTQDNKVMTA